MRALWSLNPYFLRYPWHLLGGVVFVIASAVFSVYPAIYIRQAFDTVSEALRLQSDSGALLRALLGYSALILLLSALRGAFTFLMRQTLIVMSRHIEYELKNDIYRHYQDLDQTFYRRNATGDLMNRISEDVSRVRMYLGPGVMYTINTAFSTGLTLVFMFQVDPKLSWITLAPMPVLVWAIYRVSTLINQRSHAVQEQQSAISTLAQETFSGIRVLKVYGLEAEQTDRYAASSEKSYQLNRDLYRVNALFAPLMMLLVGLSTVLTVWIGGEGVIEGRLSPGVIAEFVYYVGLLTWPIASIGWVMSLIQRAEASMERINDFMDVVPAVQQPNSAHQAQVQGAWTFENVSYTYPDSGIQALRDVSFTVNPGETVVVVGRTGSGKSSLVGLMNRLMDPSQGRVLLDGVDLRTWDLQALRASIGTVPQDPFLFSDSVADNIAFGSLNAERSDVERQAELADVADDIRGFPQGFDTVVGERGVTLSGGQKQRVSIARALMKQPQVLLFDDALSAVDTETEVTILSNLKARLEGLTAVLITQRLSCVHLADRIIVLEDGRVAQQGSHSELVAQPGVYAELYALQSQQIS
ncbi:MAG: ABC transporter ATP-binding protein/permease [Cryomorphaceae bacterium]|nr:ABC transporter ATP-binding protein/permease [Cryomorphaceae bacterium]